MFNIGFSFGAMLACCSAARLWKDTYISTDILEKYVICISFGQPLLNIPYVQDTVTTYPEFESTLYSIYESEDIFPRLFQYCGHEGSSEHGVSMKAFSGNTSPQKRPSQVS